MINEECNQLKSGRATDVETVWYCACPSLGYVKVLMEANPGFNKTLLIYNKGAVPRK